MQGSFQHLEEYIGGWLSKLLAGDRSGPELAGRKRKEEW